ncbi:MAG: SusC/RagA family TonB-linked outer membrane protein [Ferruginibacter sp.]|nr:SusC/RagA family TonB-linked outer membrane protein [Cytophagales bacterium]
MKNLSRIMSGRFATVVAALLLGGGGAFAQLQTIKGVVSDSLGGPLPGVNVLIKGTTVGTSTNAGGAYTLTTDRVLTPKEVLVFSFIGFATAEVPLNGSTVVNVRLREDQQTLNEVVVTALGIKREEKSLGYAAQRLGENTVKDARSNNWVSALSGKVAGLNLVGTGSGPTGSTRITLRGESSLNLSNNQALIVVDGVPISSKITGTGRGAYLAADSPVDFGSAVSDLNPDDIESVTVLKGPGATALYGSRAANGALIITTKSGQRKEKGLGVTYNSNVSLETVLRWPDYQFEYGEGRTDAYYSYLDSEDGPNTSTNVAAGRAWGPKFNGQLYYQYNPAAPDGKPVERTEWKPYEGYVSDFFRTGVTFSNSIALEGSTDRSSARLSLTHLKNEWIMPNTGFKRTVAALSVNHRISDKFKVSAKANYTNKRSDNLPLAGYNNQSIGYFMILGTAPSINIDWFKPYWQPGQENVQQRNPFNPGPDNPYLQVYEMLNKESKHGVIGTVSATYVFSPNLDVTVRSGLDLAYEERSQQRPYSMTRYPRGMFRLQNVFNYESNTDVLLTHRGTLANTIAYSVSVGANAMRQRYNFSGAYADQLAMPGVYVIGNSLDPPVADPYQYQKAINSVYAATQFAYQDMLFLDVTGRNDWSSSLPAANNSYFYPSVSTSLVLNEMLALPRAVSFAKLRFSWAQVGNDTRPYQTQKYYDRIYSNGFTNPSTLYFADLKPEITSSFEAGIDLRVLNNRLGLDVAVYRNNSRNQILDTPLDITTGYSRALKNAGLISSRGVEVRLTGTPVVANRFKWNSTLTWSMNRSYVKELTEGVPSQVLASHINASIEARVGGRMGDIYGTGFQRSPEGQVVYTAAGITAPVDPNLRLFGNAFADWKAGLLNEFTVRDFRVSLLFDGQKGGDVFSQTNHKLNTLGKTKVTLPGRDGGIVGNGVVRQLDGTYVPNTTNVSASRYYDEYYALSNVETNIFDASFIKLREARIAYSLPPAWLSRTAFKQVSIALYGRDLLLFTKFPAFDPEAANLNNDTIVPGIEIAQLPSTRTTGVNLTVTF